MSKKASRKCTEIVGVKILIIIRGPENLFYRKRTCYNHGNPWGRNKAMSHIEFGKKKVLSAAYTFLQILRKRIFTVFSYPLLLRLSKCRPFVFDEKMVSVIVGRA